MIFETKVCLPYLTAEKNANLQGSPCGGQPKFWWKTLIGYRYPLPVEGYKIEINFFGKTNIYLRIVFFTFSPS